MTKKIPETVPLIVSHKPELINNRFLVSYSTMDTGAMRKSYMLIVIDMVESGFTLKFFSDTDKVISMLKLLKAT